MKKRLIALILCLMLLSSLGVVDAEGNDEGAYSQLINSTLQFAKVDKDSDLPTCFKGDPPEKISMEIWNDKVAGNIATIIENRKYFMKIKIEDDYIITFPAGYATKEEFMSSLPVEKFEVQLPEYTENLIKGKEWYVQVLKEPLLKEEIKISKTFVNGFEVELIAPPKELCMAMIDVMNYLQIKSGKLEKSEGCINIESDWCSFEVEQSGFAEFMFGTHRNRTKYHFKISVSEKKGDKEYSSLCIERYTQTKRGLFWYSTGKAEGTIIPEIAKDLNNILACTVIRLNNPDDWKMVIMEKKSDDK